MSKYRLPMIGKLATPQNIEQVKTKLNNLLDKYDLEGTVEFDEQFLNFCLNNLQI